MEDRIRQLFATILQVDVDRIRDETDPGTLERWDSMQHLILVSSFEEEFGVDVDPEEAVTMYGNFAAFKKVMMQKLELKK
jgi:acyl carrier protein